MSSRGVDSAIDVIVTRSTLDGKVNISRTAVGSELVARRMSCQGRKDIACSMGFRSEPPQFNLYVYDDE